MTNPRRNVPFWRRLNPAAEFDIVGLLPSSLQKAERFETEADVDIESIRSERVLVGQRPRTEFAVYLSECREGHYSCERTYCPRCARAFRRHLIGELLRLSSKFNGGIKISTVLLATVTKGELGTLEIARHGHALRKRFVRAGLGDAAVIGGFEVSYRAREKIWVLHINLAIFGGDPDALAAFEAACSDTGLYRPVETVELMDAAEQLSYLLKFTTYHRPFQQTGPEKSPAVPLNPSEHYELLSWMAQHEFTDHLFLFNARRYGPTIKLTENRRKA
ncbi:hypothetical protein V5279_36095 [Bradyrhizobium sp. 26S5]|uniref:hypothetical protein n=1 Tax=Bradyrhizobium sp. 26S5 TaxID=3139729 RepID=UPI0030D0BE49